ncbi:MAG: hypothetical protein WCW13_00850 [archaeon]
MKKFERYIYVVQNKNGGSALEKNFLKAFDFSWLVKEFDSLNTWVGLNKYKVSFALLSFIFALFLLKGF